MGNTFVFFISVHMIAILSEVTLNLHLYLLYNAIAKSKGKTINQKS